VSSSSLSSASHRFGLWSQRAVRKQNHPERISRASNRGVNSRWIAGAHDFPGYTSRRSATQLGRSSREILCALDRLRGRIRRHSRSNPSRCFPACSIFAPFALSKSSTPRSRSEKRRPNAPSGAEREILWWKICAELPRKWGGSVRFNLLMVKVLTRWRWGESGANHSLKENSRDQGNIQGI